MIRFFFRRLRKNERGAAMLEFALAVSFLLLLIFGIIDFAWILHGHITLTGAVREGVRLAVISNNSEISENEIKQAVIAHARTFNLEPADIEVFLGNYSEETSVEVAEAELPLLVGIVPFVGKTYVISGTRATMMHE